ncbi:hypothetical protein ACIQ9Q_43375 [Streptomyces sp. NPDC094438]|uniref:hypothetical protein n=1 Tax=Streptomyces sp. NPDC094438 TaxID=3366061 RepID=UPI003820EB1F
MPNVNEYDWVPWEHQPLVSLPGLLEPGDVHAFVIAAKEAEGTVGGRRIVKLMIDGMGYFAYEVLPEIFVAPSRFLTKAEWEGALEVPMRDYNYLGTLQSRQDFLNQTVEQLREALGTRAGQNILTSLSAAGPLPEDPGRLSSGIFDGATGEKVGHALITGPGPTVDSRTLPYPYLDPQGVVIAPKGRGSGGAIIQVEWKYRPVIHRNFYKPSASTPWTMHGAEPRWLMSHLVKLLHEALHGVRHLVGITPIQNPSTSLENPFYKKNSTVARERNQFLETRVEEIAVVGGEQARVIEGGHATITLNQAKAIVGALKSRYRDWVTEGRIAREEYQELTALADIHLDLMHNMPTEAHVCSALGEPHRYTYNNVDPEIRVVSNAETDGMRRLQEVQDQRNIVEWKAPKCAGGPILV